MYRKVVLRKSLFVSLLCLVPLAGCISMQGKMTIADPTDAATLSTTTSTPLQAEQTPRAVAPAMQTSQALASQVVYSTRVSPTPLPDSWVQWIDDNSHEISSLTSNNYADLEFLEALLADSRLVQLGESAHRTAEYSLLKVRLIRYLHEELGYNVIAFESGLVDCYLADGKIGSWEAVDVMNGCVFGIWRTEEVLPLFEYLVAQSGDENRLVLAGFDIQPSGDVGNQTVQLYSKYVEALDPVYAREVERLERAFLASLLLGSAEGFNGEIHRAFAEKDPVEWYDGLASFFEENHAQLQITFPNEEKSILVARQSAWSRARFIESINSSRSVEQSNIRDGNMAENVKFLLEELYPEEKIIIWAHNAHIANKSWNLSLMKNMGSQLKLEYENDIYTIGFFSSDDPPLGDLGQSSQDLSLLGPLLEALLDSAGKEFMFLDLQKQEINSTSSWVFETVSSKWQPSFVPQDQYDGLLFVEELSSPTYLSED